MSLLLLVTFIFGSSPAIAGSKKLPKLRQVVTVARARARVKTPIEQPQKVATGFITQQPIGPQLPTEAELEAVDLLPGTRLLTTQEAVALLLSDFDGDGVPAIRDASPRDGGIRTRSEALVSVKLKKDPVEALITLFESTEAMCEYALEENLQDPIFDSEALIHAAERAGMEQKVCDRWRKRFVKGGK